MLDLPTWLKPIIDAGGWAAFAALAVAVILGFVSDKIVSKGRLDAEITGRAKAEERADKAAKQVETLNADARESNATIARMAQSLELVEDFVRDVIRERLAERSREQPRQRGPGR